MGIGTAIHGITPTHAAFLAIGGPGLLIGDGRLNRYSPKSAFEAFCAGSLTKAMTVTFDYQPLESPAYNGDRGPADFLAARLHVNF